MHMDVVFKSNKNTLCLCGHCNGRADIPYAFSQTTEHVMHKRTCYLLAIGAGYCTNN